MLIFFCVLCPPLIPFVALYYLFGGRAATRKIVQTQKRLIRGQLATAKLIAVAARDARDAQADAHADQLAALTTGQQTAVLAAREQVRLAKRSRARRAWGKVW